MNKLLVFLCALFTFSSLYAEKHALIIAIGEYPSKTGWSAISSVNDVPLIKQSLLDQEFSEENILVLINENATKAGIQKALQDLQSRIAPGDVVVIHYSGHGQQIFDDNGEEIDDLDEALIPYDAFVKYTHNYNGENHIRDDELGNIIAGFRNKLGKDGQLLFLLDSCHSGSATRGGKTRGGEAAFAPPGWNAGAVNGTSGSAMFERTEIKDNAAPFVMISGASADELNYEYDGYGSLSFAFSKAMNELGSNFTYRQLFSKIAANMSIISPKQTPTIEGDTDYKLFKGEYVKQQPYFEALNVPREDVIKIQAGKLQGIFENTTVNILPAGTTTVTDDNIISTGKIVLSKYNEANIQLDQALPNRNEKDYWVFLDEKAYGDMAVRVYLDKTVRNSDVATGIAEFLKQNNLGEILNDSINSDVIITQSGDHYSLNATNGQVEFAKAEKSRGLAAVEELQEKLFNFVHGQYLKNLNLDNPDYEFSFRLLPIAYDLALEQYGDTLPEDTYINEAGIFAVRPQQDQVVLEVTNTGDKAYYFSIIEINSKGEIFPFMPNTQCDLNNNERKLEPGKTMVFKDCIFSFGPPFEKLMLKGFASPDPINFQSTVETRGKGTRGSQNPLESFLAGSYNKTRGPEANKVSGKIDGYSTEFIYEIVEE